MAFDPDAYLAKTSTRTSSGFDPDAYLAKGLTPGSVTAQISGDVPAPSEFKRFLPAKEDIPEIVGSMAGSAVRKFWPGMAVSAGGAAIGEGIRQAMSDEELTALERGEKLGMAALRGGLGETAGRGVGALVGKAISPFKGSVPEEVAGQLASAERAGIKPNLSNISESPMVQAIERQAEYSPFGGFITRMRDATVKNLESFSDRISEGIATAEQSPQVLSQSISDRIKTFKQVFKKQADNLYKPVMEVLKDKPADTSNTIGALENIIDKRSGTAEPAGLGKIRGWLDEIMPSKSGIPSMLIPEGEGSVKTIGHLKRLQSNVGDFGDWKNPMATGLDTDIQQLYAAIKQDIKSSAFKVDPKIGKALQDVDDLYSVGIKKMQFNVAKAIGEVIDKNPSELHRVIFVKNKDYINIAKEILGPDTFNEARKQWFDDLIERSRETVEGRIGLSPSKLANNLRKFDGVLEDIADSPELAQKLTDLSNVSQLLTRGRKVTHGSQTGFLTDIISDIEKYIGGSAAAAFLGGFPLGKRFSREYLTRGFPRVSAVAGKTAEVAAKIPTQIELQSLKENQ